MEPLSDGRSDSAYDRWNRIDGDLTRLGKPSFARAGEIVMRDYSAFPDESRVVLLILDGLVRSYVESPSRQMTIRYASAGGALGLRRFLTEGYFPVFAQAITDAHFMALSDSVVMSLMGKSQEFTESVLDAMLEAHLHSTQFLVQNVTRPVRSRVARHLLEMSVSSKEGRKIVQGTHQDIASAIGSVREVVSRAISQLAQFGYIERRGRFIVIIDHIGLHREASR